MSDKILEELRRALRTPDAEAITEHAARLVRALDYTEQRLAEQLASNEQLRDLLAVAKKIITEHHRGSEAQIEYWGRLCPVCTSYLPILDAIYASTHEITP